MDPRWHTNHDSKPAGLDSQRPVNWPHPLSAESFVRAESQTEIYQPTSATLATDVRFFQAEIAKLRQLLASTQAEHTQHADEVRRAARQAFSRQESELVNQIETLKRQIEVLEHEACEAEQNHEQRLAVLRSKLDAAQQMLRTSTCQIDVLKQEIKNVANTASAEQREFAERHRSFVDRHNLVVDEKDDSIQTLETQVAEYEDSLNAWQIAHEQAIFLCEWLQQRQLESRERIADLHAERDRFHSRASEAFAICDDEIEMLEATVTILRTDHETVELIAADLDHQNDELQCTIHELQRDLDSVVKKAICDRQESVRAIDTVNGQFHATSARLNAVSEEKMSFIESIAELKASSDEFDAALFAKDQEISATKRVSDDAQKQLQQLRREHAVLAGQNDQMRNQIREASSNIARLESERTKASDRADQAESVLSERDRQLREVQSSARAAEAHAMLRANEAEHHFATELQRLESELDHQRETDEREARSQSDLLAKIATLEGSLVASQHAATASSAEKDHLQLTVDQLTEQLKHAQIASGEKDDRIASLDASIDEIRSKEFETANQAEQVRREDAERRTQLAEYANRIATQQNAISKYEEELAQANIRLEQTIESELTAKRDELISQLDESTAKNSELETQLASWAVYQNPMNEVKRLTVELAKRIADHARERESLIGRIEQLQTSRSIGRAA